MLSSFARLSFRVLQAPKVLEISVVGIDRRYSTPWTHRTPVEIVNEDDIFGVNKEGENFDDVQRKGKKYQNRGKSEVQRNMKKKKKKNEIPGKIIQTDSFEYEFLKENNHKLTTLMTNIRCTKTNKEENPEIILEGHRLIVDGIKGGAIPSTFIFSKVSDVVKMNLPKDVTYYKVPYRALNIWSNLTTSPGLIGIFTAPNLEDTPPPANALPLTIICNNVRNPENLGAVIRAAAGVGCKRLILMKGCVDVWDFKVLRSAVGAHFRVPIYRNQDWASIDSLVNPKADFIIADHNVMFNPSENPTDLNEPVSESRLNPEDDETSNVDSDTDSDIDSNLDTDLDSDLSDDDYTESDSNSEMSPKQKHSPVRFSERSQLKLTMRRLLSRLPIAPYHSVDYTKNEVVLVLGGETEGLDISSFELIKQGTRINIPLANNVDSLNVGMAIGILTFEIKRQFLLKHS